MLSISSKVSLYLSVSDPVFLLSIIDSESKTKKRNTVNVPIRNNAYHVSLFLLNLMFQMEDTIVNCD